MSISNENVSPGDQQMQVHQLMTMEEVSEATRIPVNTLRFYRHKGLGPRFAKLGGRLMAKREDVTRWIESAFEAEAS